MDGGVGSNELIAHLHAYLHRTEKTMYMINCRSFFLLYNLQTYTHCFQSNFHTFYALVIRNLCLQLYHLHKMCLFHVCTVLIINSNF